MLRSGRFIIHTRNDLLDFVTRAVKRRSIQRALSEGTVEVLGGFIRIPPLGLPGWCLRARSPITDDWYEIGITVEAGNIYRVWNLTPNGGIPWGQWIGDHVTDRGNILVEGDRPDMCRERMNNARIYTTTTSKEDSKEV